MVEITGGREDRAWAEKVADWCARELEKSRLQSGTLETRPFVQNADLIIAALREYAQRPLGVASVGPSFRDMTKDVPRSERAFASAQAKMAKAGPGEFVQMTPDEMSAMGAKVG